jgi:hypothetical protein
MRLGALHLAVVVAVAAVRVVQVAFNEVIDVVAVRHGLVSAGGAVPMALLMTAAVVLGRAFLGVVAVDFELMFLHAALADVMQVSVVQVVDVTLVLQRGVPAAGAVLVLVVAVLCRCHRMVSFSWQIASESSTA